MDPYASDREQVETLKSWWRKNGKPIMGGLLIGLGAAYGWKAWQSGATRDAEAASAAYEEVMNRLQKEKDQGADELGKDFMSEYESSAYASFVALMRARVAVQAGDLPRAKEQLRWVMEHSPLSELKSVARLRLARLLVAEGNGDEAWTLVDGRPESGADSPAYKEIQGDIRWAQQRPEEARRYYEEALALSAAGGAEDPDIRMKLDELGVAAPVKSPP